MLPQSKDEATATVKGRLDFIEKEIKRREESIKGLQDKGEKVKTEVMAVQQRVQMAQQQSGRAVGDASTTAATTGK